MLDRLPLVMGETMNQKNKPDAPDITGCHMLAARLEAGHTQAEAAAIVYRTLRCWQDWEGSQRNPDPALLELYLIKTKLIDKNDWRIVFPKK